MKAMILAAGKGERLRPLTLTRPKPLVLAGGKSLLAHWLDKLEATTITDVVINCAYLGEQIVDFCVAYNGRLNIHVSREREPLETGGAILQALPLLGDQPFLLINGDVYCDFDLQLWLDGSEPRLADGLLGHFLMVSNPCHNPNGDYRVVGGRIVKKGVEAANTFAGISILSPKIVSEFPDQKAKFPLREAFQWAMAKGKITGEVYQGYWQDVGTLERLKNLDFYLNENRIDGSI